ARSHWYAACCSVAVTASRCRCCPTEPTVVPLTCCLDLCAREPQGLSTVNRGAGRRGEMSGPREGDPMTRLDRRTFMRAAAAGAAVTASGGLRLPDASASTRQAAYRGPRATRVLPSLTQAG